MKDVVGVSKVNQRRLGRRRQYVGSYNTARDLKRVFALERKALDDTGACAYFDPAHEKEYANSLNQRCDKPLGRVGRTGNYDGCPVWIVAGWLAQPVYKEGAVVHHGLLNESSSKTRNAWSSELSKRRH